MALQKIDIGDKELFQRYLSREKRELAAYSFENIFIWKGLYDIYRDEMRGSLCVFFKSASDFFLYLPPLGGALGGEAVNDAFALMNERNGPGSAASRIENVRESDLAFFRGLGYRCAEKPGDYVCLTSSIASYKGEKLKHKRSAYNHFVKNNSFEYSAFSPRDAADCLRLYDQWAEKRGAMADDRIYKALLADSRAALGTTLDSYASLKMAGRIIRIGGELKAFTFGYPLDDATFTVLYEVTDLAVKGLSQYIFSRFASELTHKYLNIMDDSGLESLKEAKLSFHPEKIVPAYIAVRR